jgi:16S rRNA (adenine1518-N6/adenine1519-N6)-dimethyltransferase
MGEAGLVNKEDIVLEIGPGKGALTEKLLSRAKKVIAIEKDRDLIEILKEKFKEEILSKKLELIEADILEVDPKDLKLKNNEYKIIANIPYNITGAIFKKFLSGLIKPSTMVLLVQKEVATRIVANDKKESILSLSVKAFGTPSYVMKVGKRFFSPSPKVDSAIVAIKNISSANFKSDKYEDNFFKIVKTGFAHKRKVLRKNLEDLMTTEVVDQIFSDLNINPKTRAEDLNISKWLQITERFSK